MSTPKCLDADMAFSSHLEAGLNNANSYCAFASNGLPLHLIHEISAKVMQLDKLKVSAPSVLRMIPDEMLAMLARDTKVDY